MSWIAAADQTVPGYYQGRVYNDNAPWQTACDVGQPTQDRAEALRLADEARARFQEREDRLARIEAFSSHVGMNGRGKQRGMRR